MTKRQLIIFHAFFWFVLLFYGEILQAIGDNSYKFNPEKFTKPLWLSSNGLNIFGTYLVLWLLNRFFDKRQFFKLTIGIIFAILAYIFLRFCIEERLFFQLFGFHNYVYGEDFTWLYYVTDSFYNGISFIFSAALLKLVPDFFKHEKIKNELLHDKNTAELAFLKSQLNPHFLFNTLNNIYVLTYKKSDKAPEAMLKLSEMMRYMLYESNEPTVLLEKEVRYLDNMIELQRMRLEGNPFIDVLFQGDFTGKQIAPLILAPFIENAFKHGEFYDADSPLIIHFQESNGNVNFLVKNKKGKHLKDAMGGIGTTNVRRRLEMLYPNRYNLDISDEATEYTCELNLIL